MILIRKSISRKMKCSWNPRKVDEKMKRSFSIPPVYFSICLVLCVVVCPIFPVMRIIPFPYNLSGIVFVICGIIFFRRTNKNQICMYPSGHFQDINRFFFWFIITNPGKFLLTTLVVFPNMIIGRTTRPIICMWPVTGFAWPLPFERHENEA